MPPLKHDGRGSRPVVTRHLRQDLFVGTKWNFKIARGKKDMVNIPDPDFEPFGVDSCSFCTPPYFTRSLLSSLQLTIAGYSSDVRVAREPLDVGSDRMAERISNARLQKLPD